MSKISGIRCTKCNKGVSHVVTPNFPQIEALMVQEEDRLASQHRKECDGVVERFERDE